MRSNPSTAPDGAPDPGAPNGPGSPGSTAPGASPTGPGNPAATPHDPAAAPHDPAAAPDDPAAEPGAPAALARGRSRGLLQHALVLLPLLLCFVTGLRGIDFGHHWDESIQVENLQRAIDTQTLLPKWYRYPSVLFWMTLGALTPEIASELPRNAEEMKATQARLTKVAKSNRFRLRLRSVFLVATCLSVLWTWVAAYLWRGSLLEAFLAASLLGLSWEVGYHARWVAPDGILMQFGALTLMLASLAIARRDGRWLWGAALAAGLGCGTKYTGGILLLPLWVGAWQVWRGRPAAARLGRCAGLTAAFALAFIASTPGAVLQPFVFLRHVGFEIEHYRTGHYGATVEAGLPHLVAILRYLGAHLFSWQSGLALAASGLSVAGAVLAVRRSPRRALLVGCVPLLYVLYMSTQRVMFVRNLLLVAPMLALFAAHGATRILDAVRERAARTGRASARWRWAAGGVVAVLWGVNTPYLIAASQSIRDRDVDRDVRAAHAWLTGEADGRVFVSPRVRRKLGQLELALPDNATPDPRAAVDAALFFPAETPSNAQLEANRPGTSLAVFGPLDVNFPYYPAWPNPKVVAYPADAARRVGVLDGPGPNDLDDPDDD